MIPDAVPQKTQAPSPILELDRLAREIEDDLLAFASPGARAEWLLFKETCSTAASAGRRPFSPSDELAILVDKARRFRAVLLLAT
jgi:hypothetical protein